MRWAWLCLFSCQVFALEVSEDFSSMVRFSSGNAVWNSARGVVHPPLEVYQYIDGATQSRTISLGTGGQGSFTQSRYREFSRNGELAGQWIRIDTDRYPVLEFTDFHLAAGWTIWPVGTNPLVIRVLGDVIIEGQINCSGGDGEDHNGNVTLVAAGGEGICGGGTGGDGATTTVAAESGFDGGTVVADCVALGVDGPSGGGGASGLGAGGGGGGAYAPPRAAPDASENGDGAGFGARGQICEDNDFDNVGGGFGGGGGGYYNAGAVSQNSSGAGGGGGGGMIFISAGGNISITGQVYARGGDGGDDNGSTLAGGGGGGGGGSIALFAGGDVYISGASAVVSASGGMGRGPLGGEGGNGAAGRTWLVGQSGYSILVAPAVSYEFPDPSVADVGAVRYQLGTFTVTSGMFDTGNSAPTLTALNLSTTLSVGGSVQALVATSESQSLGAAYASAGSLPMSLSRYASVQLELVNGSRTSPTVVNELTLALDGSSESNFEFVSACGRISTNTTPSLLWLWFLLPLMTWFTSRYRALIPVENQSKTRH